MTHTSGGSTPGERPLVPHVTSALLVGLVFLVATLLAAALPAIAVAYLIVGFEVRTVVVVRALWAASVTVSVLAFVLILPAVRL